MASVKTPPLNNRLLGIFHDKEMIPENMVKNINKDNLLNDLKLMNIKNVKEITLTR